MGGVGKAESPGSLDTLQSMGERLFNQGSPARKTILSQLQEALKTGGVGAKIPLIQQAVSASNQANSAALKSTSEQLAQRNIGGPFASRILAAQRLTGEQNTARLPTSIAENFISQMTPFLSSTQSLGVGAIGQTASLENQLNQFNAQAQGAMIGGIAKAFGPSLGGLMGGTK